MIFKKAQRNCPNCRSHNITILEDLDTYSQMKAFRIACKNCGYQISKINTEEAIWSAFDKMGKFKSNV